MKKLIFTAFLGLFGASLFAYDIASISQLKTKARSVTETDFSIVSKFGEYFRTPSVKYVYSYDSRGRITESSEFTPRNSLENRIANTYDANGNLSSQTCYDSDGKIIWRTESVYKDGLKTETSEYASNDSLAAKTIYTYTDRKLSDESYYNSDGALIWKIIFSYNSDGKTETENEYSGDGKLDEKRQYAYTADGLIESITYFDSDEKLKSKEIFRYSADKSLNEITAYDAENAITKRSVVRLDGSGNISRITDYNVSKKFGTTVNEMSAMKEYVYDYSSGDEK